MEGTLRCTLGSQAQHTHSLEYPTQYIQQSTSTHTKHVHNIQQQPHPNILPIVSPNNSRTHKTNRSINRATHTIQGYDIRHTTTQVQEAIKQSKNNTSQGPDKLNIRHLIHIGPLGLAFLTSMLKTALSINILPHISSTDPRCSILYLCIIWPNATRGRITIFIPMQYHSAPYSAAIS